MRSDEPWVIGSARSTHEPGDDGTTGLANGERVDKADLRVGAFGDVDETNSALGSAACGSRPSTGDQLDVSRASNTSCSRSAQSSRCRAIAQITGEHVARLEQDLDALNDELPPLKEFVLPGGTRAAAICHLARTICRRAERSAWAASKLTALNPELTALLESAFRSTVRHGALAGSKGRRPRGSVAALS